VGVKKRTSSIDVRNLGIPRLWRDDLERIEKIMRDVNPALTIRAGDYDLDSVADLADLVERRLSTLGISTVGEPNLELHIDRWGAKLSAVEPSPTTLGAMYSIQRQLPKWRAIPTVDVEAVGAALFLVGIVAFSLLVTGFISETQRLMHHRGVLTRDAAFVWGGIAALLAVGRLNKSWRPVINTVTRAEAPNFWQRTRDDWIVNLVFLAVGLALGYFVGKI